MTSFKAFTTSLVLLIFTATAPAQGSRRELATPGLVVETGYRLGGLDVLFFTPDGKYLLAAGDDKVVRTWKLQGDRLEPIREGAGEPRSILRWPSMRELRGNIYAAALSPDGRDIVVAGLGLKDSQVALLDRYEGTTKKIIDAISKDNRKARFNIWSIAFAPSGKFVLVGGNDGSLWRWDLTSAEGTLVGHQPVPPVARYQKYNPIRLIHFLSEREVVTGDEAGQVVKWDLGTGSSRIVAKIDPKLGARRYAALDRKVAIAWNSYFVTIVDVDSGKTQLLPLPNSDSTRHVPSALAFDRKTGNLAIAASILDLKANFHKEVGQKTYLTDLRGERPTLKEGPGASYRVEAVTFHPREDLLVLGGGEHHEITLWRPAATGWKEVSRLEGPGRAIYGLRLSSDGKTLAYQTNLNPLAPSPNEWGQGAWNAFDLKGRKFVRAESLSSFIPRIPKQDGWSVITTRSDGWSVSNSKTGAQVRLDLDFNRLGLPKCYSFLPKSADGKVHLVVGHYLGATVFELSGTTARPVRYLIGHDGEVYCLAVAQTKNGLLLVTGGRDGTVCGWALDAFPSHPMFGVQLLSRDNRVIVGKVDPQSPAWEMGMSPGDEIESIYMTDPGSKRDPYRPIFQRGNVNLLTRETTGPIGKPQDVVDTLETHPAGQEIVAFWSRAGHKGLLGEKTTLKERPVWRFFPTRDQEWVLWRVSDYFYDCSTAGDQFIGWHVNTFTGKGYDLQATPRFYPAERLKVLYHQPAKISQTLSTWARQDTVLQTGRTREHAAKKNDRVLVDALNLLPVKDQRVQFANHATIYTLAGGSTRSELVLEPALTNDVPPGTRLDLQAVVPFQALEPAQVDVKLNSKPVIKAGDISLRIQVTPRSSRENQQLTRLQVWINDYLYERLEGERLPLIAGKDAAGEPIQLFQRDSLTIPGKLLRSGKNRILVQAFNKADSRSDGTPIVVTLDRPRGEVTFHGLFVGVGDYSKVSPNPGRNVDLRADLDAAALARVFEEYAGRQYKKTNVITLTNEKVTPAAVLDQLKKLVNADPDDLLLFHLGGHGLNLAETAALMELDIKSGGKRSFTPRHLDVFRRQSQGMGKFVYMCGNFNMENLPATTLRIDQLYEHLVKIPCQKVILMDACHSGAVEPPLDGLGKIFYPESKQSPDNQHANDLIRLLAPDQVGPIIFQACGAKEAALEIRGLTNVDKIYGLFSQAMVETIVENFEKADRNKNSGLEPQELHDYITRMIPAFLNDFRKRNPELAVHASDQNPRLFLPDFARDFIIVRPTD